MKAAFRLVLVYCLIPLVFLLGCSGGGSSPANLVEPTPEAAVAELFNNVKATKLFRYDSQGQVLAQETTSSETGSSDSGYLSFRGLDGETWTFKIIRVEYLTDSNASVYTSYYYSSSPQFGGLNIVFKMIKDQGLWFLEGMEITDLPAVVVDGTGINGAITDGVTRLPVSQARVEAYNSANELVGFAVTDANGYYEILELSPGTYYLVVSREGYAPYTISGIQVK